MNDFKISILFVLQKVKTNKKGLCPLKCRLTYLKKRKEFSTGIFINPEHWDSGKQKALLSNKENKRMHEKLAKNNIAHHYIERPGAHSWEYWSESIKYQILFFSEFFDMIIVLNFI